MFTQAVLCMQIVLDVHIKADYACQSPGNSYLVSTIATNYLYVNSKLAAFFFLIGILLIFRECNVVTWVIILC